MVLTQKCQCDRQTSEMALKIPSSWFSVLSPPLDYRLGLVTCKNHGHFCLWLHVASKLSLLPLWFAHVDETSCYIGGVHTARKWGAASSQLPSRDWLCNLENGTFLSWALITQQFQLTPWLQPERFWSRSSGPQVGFVWGSTKSSGMSLVYGAGGNGDSAHMMPPGMTVSTQTCNWKF